MTAQNQLYCSRPPHQERSRRALRRILEAAVGVLREDGLDGFTIADVAVRANTSVGGIYRRFAGKAELLAAVKGGLLDNLDELLDERLGEQGLALRSGLNVFVQALTETFGSEHGSALSELGRERDVKLDEIGQTAIRRLEDQFDAGVAVHRQSVRRQDKDAALAAVKSTIISACIHRAVSHRIVGDPVDWNDYANHLSDMCFTYLTTADSEG